MSGYRRASGVAIVEHDEVVYAASVPDGPIVVLDGIAAFIWTEACAGDPSTIAERVASATGSRLDDVRADVEAFVDELVDRGLLTVEAG